jgi:hypothetical protein
VVFNMNADFRRGVEKEWRNYGGGLIVQAHPAPSSPATRA